MIIVNRKLFVMDQDKEKDIDQQSNPSFTKKDLLGKQEQSEPAELEERSSAQETNETDETIEKESAQEEE